MLGFARAGATVYASYFAGSGRDQPGPWLPWIEQVFGVTHRLRYGLADTVPTNEVNFELVRDLGKLSAGTRLTFALGGEGFARAYLPVEPAGAEVLAVDDDGRPALLRNRAGEGWTVLCTYPLEHMAASRPAANPEPTWQLYSALADESGVNRPVRVEDPRVVIGAIQVGGKEVYLALNISPDAIDAKPMSTAGPVHLAQPSQGEPMDVLRLGPYEVAVLYTQ